MELHVAVVPKNWSTAVSIFISTGN